MKPIRYFLILYIFFYSNFLQANDTLIAPIVHSKLKKGIFRTFEEFKNNQPSILDSFIERKIMLFSGTMMVQKIQPLKDLFLNML